MFFKIVPHDLSFKNLLTFLEILNSVLNSDIFLVGKIEPWCPKKICMVLAGRWMNEWMDGSKTWFKGMLCAVQKKVLCCNGGRKQNH
jgi:hypothetical protein